MDLREHLHDWLPQLREAKEQMVIRDPKDPDCPTVIEIYRQDELICTMMCEPNRDLMLMLLKFAIIGMEADMVAYNTEVVSTTHPVNPGTGKPWGPDEKLKVLRDHPDYWFEGLVEEALLTTIWDRSGNAISAISKFAINGTETTWGDCHISEDGGVGGYITEEVSMFWHEETMAEQAQAAANGERPDLPDMAEKLRKELAEMPLEERQARQDLTIMLVLQTALALKGQMAAIALHAKKDSMRAKMINERAPQLGLGVNVNPD